MASTDDMYLVNPVQDPVTSTAGTWPVELDETKLSPSQWILYFTTGRYQEPGNIREVQESMMRLKRSEYEEGEAYDIWYSSWNDHYSITSKTLEDQECVDGQHLGGFIVQGCDLKFLLPEISCPEGDNIYVRSFEDEQFGPSYEDRSLAYSPCNMDPCATDGEVPLEVNCQPIRGAEFSTAFRIDCTDINEDIPKFAVMPSMDLYPSLSLVPGMLVPVDEYLLVPYEKLLPSWSILPGSIMVFTDQTPE